MGTLPRPLRLLLVLTACCGGACGAGATQTRLAYSDQAQAAYADALSDFFDGDCLVAEPAFQNVRRNFPYSRFAALAELRAADCMFEQGKYPEAIQTYSEFIRYRPSHEEVPYARFRIALCHYEQIPSDWLLSPPAYERDQRFTHDALSALRRFILDFPEHPLLERAQELAGEAITLLAEHELYVANFYLDRDAPKAAVGRLRTLLRSYGGSGHEPEALLLLGTTYETLNSGDKARDAYQELLSRFPESEQARTARQQLATLGG